MTYAYCPKCSWTSEITNSICDGTEFQCSGCRTKYTLVYQTVEDSNGFIPGELIGEELTRDGNN